MASNYYSIQKRRSYNAAFKLKVLEVEKFGNRAIGKKNIVLMNVEYENGGKIRMI